MNDGATVGVADLVKIFEIGKYKERWGGGDLNQSLGHVCPENKQDFV